VAGPADGGNPVDEEARFGTAQGTGRVLGVDLGTRRVGLALTDELRILSSPLDTVPMVSEKDLVDRLVRLCREKGVTLAVVGLPVSADGSEGPLCERARRVIRRLSDAGIPSMPQDESWSSREAEGVLRQTGRTRKNAKAKVDAIAASIILREFLEAAPPS
jgi:putative holliday junction resolvase